MTPEKIFVSYLPFMDEKGQLGHETRSIEQTFVPFPYENRAQLAFLLNPNE